MNLSFLINNPTLSNASGTFLLINSSEYQHISIANATFSKTFLVSNNLKS
jgi:hypothetical protein